MAQQKQPEGYHPHFSLWDNVKQLLGLSDQTPRTDPSQIMAAVAKKEYRIARALISEGLLPTVEATNSLITSIGEKVAAYGHNPSQATFLEITDMLETLDVFSKHCQNHCLFGAAHKPGGAMLAFSATMYLKIFASQAATKELRDKILSVAARINDRDQSESEIIAAKNLLLLFPSNNVYKLALDHTQQEKILVQSDFHHKIFTTELVADSMAKFVAHLKKQPLVDLNKVAIFEKIAADYKNAQEFVSKAGDPITAEKAFTLLNQGQTLLLPSEQDSPSAHFVNIMLSKKDGVFMIANSGPKAHRLPGNPAGNVFYQMHRPEKVTPKLIHEILINKNKMLLPNETLGLEKLQELAIPTQQFNDCTLQGHRDALIGLAYRQLQPQANVSDPKAQTIAQNLIKEWDEFVIQDQINDYLEQHDNLPASALADIFVQWHAGDSKPSTKGSIAVAQKLVAALVSDKHLKDFSQWLQSNSTNEVAGYFDEYALDINDIAQSAAKMRVV
jgi:hypothetical protein